MIYSSQFLLCGIITIQDGNIKNILIFIPIICAHPSLKCFAKPVELDFLELAVLLWLANLVDKLVVYPTYNVGHGSSIA